MRKNFGIAIGFVTLLTLVCTSALAVTPPYSENFEGGVYGDSVSTLSWRILGGDVKIGQNPGYGAQWGTLCMNGGINPLGSNVALYDFSAPITSGQVSLTFDAWSVNYQVINAEFGFVRPQYSAGWPGIRWLGGLNTWRLYVPDAGDWTYSGGGDQSVFLEMYVDLDAKTVQGAVTDSTGRHESPIISYTVATSLTGLGYVNNKANAWANFSADNINVTAVPEPSVLFSLGTGLLTIAGFGLRRRAR